MLEAQYHEITLGTVTTALCVLVSVTYVRGQFHVSVTKKETPVTAGWGVGWISELFLRQQWGQEKYLPCWTKTLAFKHVVSLSLIDPFQSIQKDKRDYVTDKNVFFYSRDLIPK